MEPAELDSGVASSHQDAQVAMSPRRRGPRWGLPLVLFLLTCWTTSQKTESIAFGACIMLILLCHEFGHYLMARRRGVDASLPFFIPMPISPFGTMGAVIGMPPRQGNRRDIFDIGIAGPLAGLVPTLICCWYGLKNSTVGPLVPSAELLGEPLLMQWMVAFLHPDLGSNQGLYLHPVAFAGWAGLFVTTLNLLPVSQLDGGHILYGMLRQKSYPVANGVLAFAIVATVLNSWWQWSLMLVLLVAMGAEHPPTADDSVPLGTGRYWLGCLTLLMVPLGFVPNPFP